MASMATSKADVIATSTPKQQDAEESPKATTDKDKMEGSKSGSDTEPCGDFSDPNMDESMDTQTPSQTDQTTVEEGTGQTGLNTARGTAVEGGTSQSPAGGDDSSSSEDERWGRPWKGQPKTGSRSQDQKKPKKKIQIPKLRSRWWSSSDTEVYRRGYPGKRDNPSLNVNYEFYMNKQPSYPQGDFIDTIHEKWWGDYHFLEGHHGYIQWLFPIRESGMNFYSQELQLHEIEKICKNPEAHRRVLKSYEMMLDFYGMRLKDPKTGEIERAENWKSRFRHLNHSMHNYLRITRILKCLGEFQYEHLKAPFVKFILWEAIVEETLTRTVESCVNYWLEVIRNDDKRAGLRKWAERLAEGDTTELSSS